MTYNCSEEISFSIFGEISHNYFMFPKIINFKNEKNIKAYVEKIILDKDETFQLEKLKSILENFTHNLKGELNNTSRMPVNLFSSENNLVNIMTILNEKYGNYTIRSYEKPHQSPIIGFLKEEHPITLDYILNELNSENNINKISIENIYENHKCFQNDLKHNFIKEQINTGKFACFNALKNYSIQINNAVSKKNTIKINLDKEFALFNALNGNMGFNLLPDDYNERINEISKLRIEQETYLSSYLSLKNLCMNNFDAFKSVDDIYIMSEMKGSDFAAVNELVTTSYTNFKDEL